MKKRVKKKPKAIEKGQVRIRVGETAQG